MLEIGLSRVDITCRVPGIGLMGWGVHHQKADGVAAPLHARAVVLRDPATGRRQALVCCDLWGITPAMRRGVLEALATRWPERGFDEAGVMLVATHTHSAPGGFSEFAFYNASVAGFCQEILDALVAGVVRAIVEADDARVPGRARVARGAIAVDEPVAFNRSVHAYNLNPEVAALGGPVRWEERARATDRRMTALRFEAADGRPLGLLSFFAVHGTSVHGDWNVIHPDNKGCAARAVEEAAARRGEEGFVAIFAQASAGDVSPNFRWDRARKRMIGAVDDDLEAADLNGRIQARAAATLAEAAALGPALEPALDAAILYADFERIEADPEHTGGRAGCRTGMAAVGLSMVMGTAEGWGPLFPFPRAVRAVNDAIGAGRRLRGALNGGDVAWEVHRNKAYFAETGRGGDAVAFHLFRMVEPPLPWWLDAGVRYFRALSDNDAVGANPLTPTILPVQVLRIGGLAIVGVQGEPTTVAGLRLERTARRHLAALGISDVVIAGYANAYAGYTTTAEEYTAQAYEGGSTLFGQWSLAATQTVLDQVCARLAVPAERRPQDLGPKPHRFDPQELARRSFPL